MIPNNLNNVEVTTPSAAGSQPSLTYRIVDGTSVVGKIDELDAVKQAIAIMLSVERYDYLIYSWDFGAEIKDLIGKDIAYVVPNLIRLIRECLIQDDRILEVDNFEPSKEGSAVKVSFTVHTIYGDVNASKEVII